MNINTKVNLNNGLEMPIFGLGVWQTNEGEEVINSVKWALEAGYRLIDTAKIYGNEKGVGKAIKESNIKREEIFITTKLWNEDQGYDSTFKAFDKSLEFLGLDYIDLYLIHWPVQEKRKDSWKAMEEIYKSGKVKSIGVSNYTISHLEEMKQYSEIIPDVNQVEFNVFLYQKELLDYCNDNSIKIEAYSPLTSGNRISDPQITEISKKYNKTNAQLLIRWCLQHDLIVIPKSSKKDRIIENADVFDFEISTKDMETLNLMNENARYCWDPTNMS